MPSDWDNGQNSFIHSLHRHIFVYCDVFPMFFITNNVNMKNIWYKIHKNDKECMCLKGLVPVEGTQLTNNMERGYTPTPVARHECSPIVLETLKMLKSENIMLKERLDKQQRQIDFMAIQMQYALQQKIEKSPLEIRNVNVGVHEVDLNPFICHKKVKHNNPAVIVEDRPDVQAGITQKHVDGTSEESNNEPNVENTMEHEHVEIVQRTRSDKPNPAGFMGLKQVPKKKKIVKTNMAYTLREDKIIIDHVRKNGTENLSGKQTWIKLQDSGVLPGRSFWSIRNRYLRYLKKTE